MITDWADLSRVVSHALRHEPWLYELEIDDEGWVTVDSLLASLRTERPNWSSVSQADLVAMIQNSEKKRHEILNNKIRALYGHSLPTNINRSPSIPPELLFHGTSPTSVTDIMLSGLLPMSRQFVHLSTDQATALAVGKRKSNDPVILQIQARKAHQDGLLFFKGNEKVWLSLHVPHKYIIASD